MEIATIWFVGYVYTVARLYRAANKGYCSTVTPLHVLVAVLIWPFILGDLSYDD